MGLKESIKEKLLEIKEKITNKNQKLLKEGNTEYNTNNAEHYNFQRQYGPGISNINVYRKLNENGEPSFKDVEMGGQVYNLPIYMISGAPEIQGIDGQLPEIYMYVDPEMVSKEMSYKFALESLLQPDNIARAYRENCGYLGGIDNNCQIIGADPQFVEVLKSLGLDKQNYVTDYCTDMENKMAQKREADAIIRGNITKDGQDFGFGNSVVGLNANTNDEPELD